MGLHTVSTVKRNTDSFRATPSEPSTRVIVLGAVSIFEQEVRSGAFESIAAALNPRSLFCALDSPLAVPLASPSFLLEQDVRWAHGLHGLKSDPHLRHTLLPYTS